MLNWPWNRKHPKKRPQKLELKGFRVARRIFGPPLQKNPPLPATLFQLLFNLISFLIPFIFLELLSRISVVDPFVHLALTNWGIWGKKQG